MPAEWEIDLDELLHELQERDDECVLEGWLEPQRGETIEDVLAHVAARRRPLTLIQGGLGGGPARGLARPVDPSPTYALSRRLRRLGKLGCARSDNDLEQYPRRSVARLDAGADDCLPAVRKLHDVAGPDVRGRVHDHPEVVAGRRVNAVRGHGQSLAPAARSSRPRVVALDGSPRGGLLGQAFTAARC